MNTNIILTNIIHNEDCLTTIARMPDNCVDCIITSPPYNKKSANRKPNKSDTWSGGNSAIKYSHLSDDLPEVEYQNWQINIINECLRILKPTGSFFYNHKNRTIDKGIITPYEWILHSQAIIKEEIIWDRQMIVEVDKVRFYPKTERIFWLIKERTQPKFNPDFAKLTDIWKITPTQGEERNNHPAPFPDDIPSRCICATTDEGDLIYDPFMGSGTSAVSAVTYKRKFIGSEISPEYCAIAKKRLIPYLSQTSLF